MAAVFALGLTVWQLVCALCGETPYKGTLEWISMYEKPKFSLPCDGMLLQKADALPAAAAAVLHGGAFLLFMLGFTVTGGSSLPWANILFPLIAAAIGGGLCFCLGKAMGGSTVSAMLGSLLVAFDLFHEPTPVAAMLLLLAAQYLFFRRGAEKCGFGLAAIIGGSLTLCVIWAPNSILIAVPLLLVMLLDGILRMVKGQGGLWQLILNLLLTAVAFYFCMVGAVFIMYLSHGASFSLVTLSQVLAGALRCVTPFTTLAPPTANAVVYAFAQNPALIYTLGALVFSICSLAKRKDPAALYLLIWGVGLILYALAAATAVYCIAAALSLSYMGGRLMTRQKPACAIVGASAMAALCLALTIVICY